MHWAAVKANSQRPTQLNSTPSLQLLTNSGLRRLGISSVTHFPA